MCLPPSIRDLCLGVRWRSSLACTALSVIAACSIFDPRAASEQERLDEARSRWVTQQLSNYRLNFRQLCFCINTEPVIVEVRGGVVRWVAIVSDGRQLDPESFFTVEALFNIVQDAITRGVAALSAEYDSELGYPTRISIDYMEQAVDDEVLYTTSALRPLP